MVVLLLVDVVELLFWEHFVDDAVEQPVDELHSRVRLLLKPQNQERTILLRRGDCTVVKSMSTSSSKSDLPTNICAGTSEQTEVNDSMNELRYDGKRGTRL